MAEISLEDIPSKKQEFIDSLENLNAKQVGKLLRLNILKHFNEEEDVDFCPFQVAMNSYHSVVYEEDFRLKQPILDRYTAIIRLLIQHGANVNNIALGKSVLAHQLIQLPDNFQVFNLLIDHGATVVDQDFYSLYYCFVMRYLFCRKGEHRFFYLMKKVIKLGIYRLDETDYHSFQLSTKGKRLLKSLPIVFILYCFKQRQVEAML